ncbi:MAG: hypothetical protein LBE36_00370 [Flavobacteriaceae bacterium]|jgi:hypothetical protein|nr:hypothetical protein [Flavobacteriaceae bacterium]
MNYNILLIPILAVSLLNCKSQNLETKSENPKNSEINSEKKLGEIIYFEEGENLFLKDCEMNITFNRIVEDSRCPKGVQCVWAGVAVAELTLMGIYTRPATVQISSMDFPNKNYKKSIDFTDCKITLVEVFPEREQGKSAEKYRIGLVFEKL